jgi:hypothetical protein
MARPVAASLRSVSDFLIQVTGLTAELKENLAQFFRFRITGSEALSVNLTQPADEGISVRVAREADRSNAAAMSQKVPMPNTV